MIIKASRLHKDQSGVVSIVISIIIMVILSLIAISFARIMRQEQQQAYERQLHTQAYYAAESAVNDVRREINQNLLTRQVHGLALGFEGWKLSNEPAVELTVQNAQFDGAIAFCGNNILALGFPSEDTNKGAVYIYKRLRDYEWHQIFKIGDNLTSANTDIDHEASNVNTIGMELVSSLSGNSNPTAASRLGTSLDCDSEGNLAVGDIAPGGGVHIFKRQQPTAPGGDNWRSSFKIDTPISPYNSNLWFGNAVSFLGNDTILVGEGKTLHAITEHNEIHMYKKDSSVNSWNKQTTTSTNNPGFILGSASVYSIVTNDHHVFVSTGDYIYVLTKDNNGWKQPDIGDTQDVGAFQYGRLALNGNFDYDRLVLAAVPRGTAPVTVYRYDTDLEAWKGAEEDAIADATNVDIAFIDEFSLAYAVSRPDPDQSGQQQAAVFRYTHFQPISELNLIEGQEDCRVNSGPLSEPFFDDGETVEYTCVFIDTRPDVLSYDSISTERSLVVHLQPVSADDGTDKPLSDLYIWWEAQESPTNPGPSFSSGSPTFPFPTRADWNKPGSPSRRQAPVLRVQLIPLPGSSYHRATLREQTKTFFLYPSTDNGDAVFWPDSSTTPTTPATASGEIIGGNCSSANPQSRFHPGSMDNDPDGDGVLPKRVCGVRIRSIDKVSSPSDINTYVLRILSMYEPSSITVEGYNGTERVVFKDIQVVVDATARAGHILRRIQERLPLIYIYDYPEYVLDIADDLCKNLESEPKQITYGQVGGVEVAGINSCKLSYPN